jgi:hypothetical protein
MHFLHINWENKTTILQSFDRIADKIGRDIILQVNNAKYRIVDFEFYSFAKGVFEDPYTNKSNILHTQNKLYIHGNGIGITCGDGTHYGGLLLQSIITLYEGTGQETGFMKQQYSGLKAVTAELFSNLYPLVGENHNVIQLHDIQGHNMDSLFYPAKEVFKTKRIGLKAVAKGKDNYFRNLPIRYIALVPYFNQEIKGISYS